MKKESGWMPGKRNEVLSMAKVWQGIFATPASGMDIPVAEVTAFSALISTASAALEKVCDLVNRSHIHTVASVEAFKALAAKMRYLKNNYFNSPPRTAEQLSTLGLTPRNPPTGVPPPQNQVTAKQRPLGDHLMEVTIEVVGDMVTDNRASDYGFRVFWGIMPRGGADVDAATGRKRELMRAPEGGDDLPFSKFTRKKKAIFDFDASDRGKMVYFCLRFENAKGQVGPWGPLLAWMIP